MTSRRARGIALWATVAISSSACSPFGPCVSDRIEVAFDATVTANGADQVWPLRGQVASTNLDLPTYQRLVAALIDDSVSAAGAVWTLDAGLDGQSGFLAIQLGADPAENAAFDVGGAFDGGGWGFLSPVAPDPRIAARIGDFTAGSASGTLTLLGTRPLRLQADLTVGDGTTSYRFRGAIVFSRTIEPVTCD